MPKDNSMLYSPRSKDETRVAPFTPWSLRAWPPVLWQADSPTRLRLRHMGTLVTMHRDPHAGTAGQTIWGGRAAKGEAGVAWDWIELSQGIVAMADPMSVVTNHRLLGHEGEVLTAWEAAPFLNELVRALPWQSEVERALRAPLPQ
jgi:hypothetical protein